MHRPVYPLHSALQYYSDYNSPAYAFLDASNAFDRINQLAMFKTKTIPHYYYYSNYSVLVSRTTHLSKPPKPLVNVFFLQLIYVATLF